MSASLPRIDIQYGDYDDNLLFRACIRTLREALDDVAECRGLIARKLACQSALNFDPLSASNIDPLLCTVEVVPVVHRGDPRGFV